MAKLSRKDVRLVKQWPTTPIVDTTSRGHFNTCRRQGYLQNHPPFGLGLRERVASPSLEFGIWVHEALDMVYRKRPYLYAQAPEFFNRLATHRLEEIEIEYKPWPEKLEEYQRLIDLGNAMLTEWAKWAPPRDDFVVIASEHAALIPIWRQVVEKNKAGKRVRRELKDEPPLALYYYRTDGIVRDVDGKKWVREYKTVADWWPPHVPHMSDQAATYVMAETEWYGEQIAGLFFEFLKKHTVDVVKINQDGLPTTAANLTAYVSADAYKAALIDTGAIAGPVHQQRLKLIEERERNEGHPTLRRQKVEFSPHRLRVQRTRIHDDLVEMLRPNWYKGPTAQNGQGVWNCSRCSVYELCRMMDNGGDWRETARMLYVNGESMWTKDLAGVERALSGRAG